MTFCTDNHDKMIFYSFWMTILIIIYHLAPHILKLGVYPSSYIGITYIKNFFELFGSIALNYFFCASAYKFYVSKKRIGIKLRKRIVTLLIPYFTWNTLFIILYVVQYRSITLKDLLLGYTLTPFDGPMWYILVLYVFFVLMNKCIKYTNNRIFKISVILLSIIAAVFHCFVINDVFNFSYAFWVERTCRMLPSFLTGMYFANEKKTFNCTNTSARLISMIGISACIIIGTLFGDGAIAILLMYICSFLLWIVCPNFNLPIKSIFRNDMFLVYAIHEGIIIITIALINKLHFVILGITNVFLIMILETVFIFISGIVIDIILEQYKYIDLLLTGGRNSSKKR